MWTATAHQAAVPLLSLNTTTSPIKLNPTINLGLPKSGTSSLYDYYSCGNVYSSHHKCKLETCGECVLANVEAGRPPLDSCGNYAFYGQLDVDGINYDSEGNWPGEGTPCYFPQLSALQELHDAYPTARFTLTTRPPAHWLASVVGWGLQERLVDCDLPGLPKSKGSEDELMAWFSSHLDTVREFVAAHPSHGPLLEIDIEDDRTGQVLAEATGIVRRAPSRPPRSRRVFAPSLHVHPPSAHTRPAPWQPATCWGKSNCAASCEFWEELDRIKELDQIKELERAREERAQRGEPGRVHEEAEGAPAAKGEEGRARKRATRTVSTLSSSV
jgi:hypothetical protein